MKFEPLIILRSVAAKLFAGFLAMVLLIVGLGSFALNSLNDAGDVVRDTFDRPLMAVNFARSASQKFSILEIESLRLQAKANAVQGDFKRFEIIAEDFREDLNVARTRSISDRADSIFDEVNADFSLWFQTERARILQASTLSSQLESLSPQDIERATMIAENLDIIVELQTNESFRNRESAIAKMASVRKVNRFAVISALFLAISLSIWVAWTIIRPLKSAAYVAREISSGRLDIDIPKGGRDETGLLLRAMKGMQSNIRARMEQEQSLRALAQGRLSDSLENSKDAILLTDVNGVIIVANPDVKSLFANVTDAKALIGRQVHDYLTADGIPNVVEERDEDRDFKLSDGRWFRVNASDTSEGGKLYIWSEMTQIRQATADMCKAKDTAEAANRSKTLFLAAMSHEMKTPLNAIIGFGDVVGREIRECSYESSVGLSDMMTMIISAGENMNQIVDDVLEIASDKKLTTSLSLERVEFCTLVERTVGEWKEKAEKAKVKMFLEVIRSPIYVLGDEADLHLLVKKLVDNAIKFNRPDGSVKVQLLKTDNGSVRLNVIDNGIGIEAKDVSRIFEPFQQVSQGYNRTVDGTGLGLAVASRIAKRHNTQIQLQSRLDVGSVFTVIFENSETSALNDETKTTFTQKGIAA